MTEVSLARFASILDAYGAAPHRWPPAERAAAEALVRRSPEARAMLARAAELDRLLDTLAPPEPSEAVRAAILAAAPRPGPRLVRAGRRRRAGGRAPRVGGWRAAGAALVASLLLGIVAGGALARAAAAETGVSLLQLALFDDNLPEY